MGKLSKPTFDSELLLSAQPKIWVDRGLQG